MISSRSIRNAKACARRIVAGESLVWEVAMHMPPVRVKVDGASREDAQMAALSLTPEDFAEGLIKRLQRTRPKVGDIIGTHQLSRSQERNCASITTSTRPAACSLGHDDPPYLPFGEEDGEEDGGEVYFPPPAQLCSHLL